VGCGLPVLSIMLRDAANHAKRDDIEILDSRVVRKKHPAKTGATQKGEPSGERFRRYEMRQQKRTARHSTLRSGTEGDHPGSITGAALL